MRDLYPGCTDPGWQSIGPENYAGCILGLAIDPNDNHRLYAASANGGLWRLVWSFGFLQYNWTPLTDQADLLIVTAVAVAPSDSSVYIADGSGRVLRSTDFGANWTRSTQTFGGVLKLVADPSNADRVLIASRNGFWAKVSGQPPLQLHSGDITDAAIDPGNPSIVYLGVRNVGLRKSYGCYAAFGTHNVEYRTMPHGLVALLSLLC